MFSHMNWKHTLQIRFRIIEIYCKNYMINLVLLKKVFGKPPLDCKNGKHFSTQPEKIFHFVVRLELKLKFSPQVYKEAKEQYRLEIMKRSTEFREERYT